ncbi:MAG TPA: NAD-glutamate dehydrogenase, partial [Thermomonas sp.]|nr:NAD-glutamate dehydrogenase [Thermomonas sp.]
MSKKQATANPATPANHLDPILAALAGRVAKATLAEARAFATAFYQRMDAEEFAQHGAEGWAELAADMLEFVRARKRGKASIQLFNPSLKAEGWESPHTVVQVANDDMPFLVDSVTMALAEMGIGVHVLGHPVIRIRRDKAGKLLAIGEGERESLMHLEIDRQSQAAMATIKARLAQALEDVRAIVA